MNPKQLTEHLHDVHKRCHSNENTSIANRVDDAKKLCLQQGLRFTQLREQVYILILTAEKPIGAYDLLNEMQSQQRIGSNERKPRNIAPPTVYRSLEFLLEHGFIHQLTSINAYVPCCHPRDKHIAGFLICQKCNRVQESSNKHIHEFIANTQNSAGFTVQNSVIEMTGFCEQCL